MDSKQFTGNVAIVTGAGVGIGLEIAQQLAGQGAAVLLNDLDPTLTEQAIAHIQAQGGQASAFAGDVSQVDVIQQMVALAVQTYGRVDIAVANAGLTHWGHFLDYRPEQFEAVMNLNLRGSFFLAQAVARQMATQGMGGRILFTSSVAGHQAIRFLSAYAMSKAALEMLAKSLVVELAPHGITVNCIAPGATLTPRNLADDPHYERSWGDLTPTGRVAQPSDIAQAALFLLSPAARQITGQSLIVDGGWTAISPIPRLDFVQ
jgi:3-oxoacyl-[acyl-carrier protein] reductase